MFSGREHLLDVAAVRAGIKQAALFESSEANESWWLGAQTTLADMSLRVCLHPHWVVAEEMVGLPAWYREQLIELRNATNIRIVQRVGADTRLPPRKATDEAQLLGYPLCCVHEFYRRCRLMHLFMVKRICHFAGTDKTARRRYVAAEVMLNPSTAAERAAVRAATSVKLAPLTHVAMCRSCAETAKSPAKMHAQQYHDLARRTGLADLFR